MPINSRLYYYERATLDLHDAIYKSIRKNNPKSKFFGEGQVTRHGGAILYSAEENPFEHKFGNISVERTFQLETIRNTDISTYIQRVIEMCEAGVNQETDFLIRSMLQIIDHSSKIPPP